MNSLKNSSLQVLGLLLSRSRALVSCFTLIGWFLWRYQEMRSSRLKSNILTTQCRSGALHLTRKHLRFSGRCASTVFALSIRIKLHWHKLCTLTAFSLIMRIYCIFSLITACWLYIFIDYCALTVFSNIIRKTVDLVKSSWKETIFCDVIFNTSLCVQSDFHESQDHIEDHGLSILFICFCLLMSSYLSLLLKSFLRSWSRGFLRSWS